jgi:hypothetical protein
VRELLSKLVAGGLSAAVILLWWPNFFPADNATTWLVRGVIWTLSFELLVHALLPLERELWESRVGVRVRSGAGSRLGAPRRSLRGRATVACGALAVPLTLLTFAPSPPVKTARAASVRHVTEVKRIVKVERRQVRVAKVVPVPVDVQQAPRVADPAISGERPRAAKPVVRTPARSGGTKQAPAKGGDVVAPVPAVTATPESSQSQPVEAPRVVRRSGAA